MDVAKRAIDEGRMKLTVTILPEELENHVEACCALIAERYGIYSNDLETILKEFGSRVGRREAQSFLNELVMNETAPYVISQAGVTMLSSPRFFSDEDVSLGQPFQYVMSILVKPSLELSSYDSITAEIPIDLPDELRHDYLASCVVAKNAERLITPISDDIFEAFFNDAQKSMEANFVQQGTTFEQFLSDNSLEKEQYQMMVMLHAREQLKQGFALDALADYLDLNVSEDDLDYAFEEIFPGKGNTMKQHFSETSRTFAMEDAARRMKAREWLVKNARIVEIEER